MEPNPSAQPKSRATFFQSLAKASWVSIVIAFVLNLALNFSPTTRDSMTTIQIGGGAILLLALVGMGSGIAALCAIPRHGRKGLLWPSLIGVTLWLLMAGAAIPTFLKFRKMVEHRRSPAILTAVVNTPGALRAHDPELGFSFEVPEGYEVFKAPTTPPAQRHAYVRMKEGEPNWVLLVSSLGKPMARERLRPEQIPAGSNITLADFQWRGLAVNAFRKPEKYDDQDYVTYNVQIPLRAQAIQISMGGLAKDEAKLRSLVEKLLATLDGETNW